MKLSVRRKVANGLVICLLAPKAVTMAADVLDADADGFDAFAAEEEFDLALQKGDTAVAPVLASDPCDPSGVDPSGFATVCVDPSGGLPTFCVKAPTELVTAENGSADLFEVWSGVDPSGSHFYQFDSNRPAEAEPSPAVVAFGADACERQAVWVVGQNDGEVDGDQNFWIRIRDENGNFIRALPGVNLDNDDYPGAVVDIEGPLVLPLGDSGQFGIIVQNVAGSALPKSNLIVQPTPGLEITNFAASLLGGGDCKCKGQLKDGILSFRGLSLGVREGLLVTIDAVLHESGPNGQMVTARFVRNSDGVEVDDDWSTGTALP